MVAGEMIPFLPCFHNLTLLRKTGASYYQIRSAFQQSTVKATQWLKNFPANVAAAL